MSHIADVLRNIADNLDNKKLSYKSGSISVEFNDEPRSTFNIKLPPSGKYSVVINSNLVLVKNMRLK